MSTRADFTDEEWNRLGRAPLVAALAISIADPGGPIEVLRESGAALRTIAEAASDGRYGAFVTAVAADTAAKTKRRENPLGGFRPSGSEARDQILDELRRVEALLVAKADETEADEFREWLRISAQRSAMAAREGGFLGIGGERVSEREQEMLGQLGEIFGTPSA
ncbi:MAG: hypothetical protein M3P44_13135 [Actinomycetota bacterium]|nr:hypothetical protein [Actinomycetota bacterium]